MTILQVLHLDLGLLFNNQHQHSLKLNLPLIQKPPILLQFNLAPHHLHLYNQTVGRLGVVVVRLCYVVFQKSVY